jgi:protocatechuate 3,4-dioxygenase alpha subunit
VTAQTTPSQTVGPFFSFGLRPAAELVPPDSQDAVRISGIVFDGAGEPVHDALVEIWQADAQGAYRTDFGWGRCGTDADGRFSFVTRKPGAVAGPDGDPQAPHLTVLVFARGLLKPVLTRLYFPDEAGANEVDPVLSSVTEPERATLVARAGNDGLEFDVHLQGEHETAFFSV